MQRLKRKKCHKYSRLFKGVIMKNKRKNTKIYEKQQLQINGEILLRNVVISEEEKTILIILLIMFVIVIIRAVL